LAPIVKKSLKNLPVLCGVSARFHQRHNCGTGTLLGGLFEFSSKRKEDPLGRPEPKFKRSSHNILIRIFFNSIELN